MHAPKPLDAFQRIILSLHLSINDGGCSSGRVRLAHIHMLDTIAPHTHTHIHNPTLSLLFSYTPLFQALELHSSDSVLTMSKASVSLA